MHVNSLTEIGLVRKANEDKFLADKKRGLFIVADGMGGHEAGELASSLAIKTLDEFLTLETITNNDGQVLKDAVEIANRVIYNEAKSKSMCKGMGTTITAAIFKDYKLYIAHIGDSRAYLIRDGNIRLLTKDHSLVGELIRQGELTPQEAENHPHLNILTRALGTEPVVEIDLLEMVIQPGDILLLCTDGLSNFVNDQEILTEVVNNGNNLKNTVNNLVQLALKRGGLDNITVVLVSYDG